MNNKVKNTAIILAPLIIVLIVIIFAKINHKELAPPSGAGITQEKLDFLRADWKRIANSNGLIPISDQKKVTERMVSLLNQTGFCAPVHDPEQSVIAKYEDATELQKTELVKTVYALLHSMHMGNWEEFKSTRLPVSDYIIPQYAMNSIPDLEIDLQIPEEERGKNSFEQIHEKLFKDNFKRSTYWDSVCMISSNAFSFSYWNKSNEGISGWLCMPKTEGTTDRFITEYKCSYDYSNCKKKILEQDKRLLICTYTFMAEGNPSGAVRPCRFDFVWDSIHKKWLPDAFVRALVDYEVPGATNSENTVAWIMF